MGRETPYLSQVVAAFVKSERWRVKADSGEICEGTVCMAWFFPVSTIQTSMSWLCRQGLIEENCFSGRQRKKLLENRKSMNASRIWRLAEISKLVSGYWRFPTQRIDSSVCRSTFWWFKGQGNNRVRHSYGTSAGSSVSLSVWLSLCVVRTVSFYLFYTLPQLRYRVWYVT
jgi:hypothetical protein